MLCRSVLEAADTRSPRITTVPTYAASTLRTRPIKIYKIILSVVPYYVICVVWDVNNCELVSSAQRMNMLCCGCVTKFQSRHEVSVITLFWLCTPVLSLSHVFDRFFFTFCPSLLLQSVRQIPLMVVHERREGHHHGSETRHY